MQFENLVQLYTQKQLYYNEKSGEHWLYMTNGDNTSRYILGTIGEKPLLCFGINSSTATPEKLDPTVNRVRLMAERFGYDSFVMFNVYPLRATNPDDLPPECDFAEKTANEKVIAEFVNYRQCEIWLAYGDIIEKRKYLRRCFDDVMALPELSNAAFFHRGLTKRGNPRHPLYVKNEVVLTQMSLIAV
jgi:hypothetical protein